MKQFFVRWAAVCVMAIGSSTALAQKINFDIPAQPLAQALQAFGQQSGAQVAFAPEAVQGRRSSAVSGNLSPAEALEQLLKGTGLEARSTGSSAFSVRRAD